MSKILKELLQAEIDPAFAKRAAFIFDQIEENAPKNVLDIGCGRGFYTRALCRFPFIEKIYGIDIKDAYLREAKRAIHDSRITLAKESVYHLPYPNNFFDCIILSEVLEHLEEEDKALQEIRRVLKKGGILLVTVPCEDFPFFWDPLNWMLMRVFKTHVNKDIWWLAGIWADHIRLYTQQTLGAVLKRNDLQTVTLKRYISHSWPFAHFLLYGIGKNIIERCNAAAVNRFSAKPKPLAKFLALLFRLPSIFEKNVSSHSPAVTMMVMIKK